MDTPMVVDDYMAGYQDGLSQKESNKYKNTSVEYIHGFSDALYDLLDVTDRMDN